MFQAAVLIVNIKVCMAPQGAMQRQLYLYPSILKKTNREADRTSVSLPAMGMAEQIFATAVAFVSSLSRDRREGLHKEVPMKLAMLVSIRVV